MGSFHQQKEAPNATLNAGATYTAPGLLNKGQRGGSALTFLIVIFWGPILHS